MNFPLFASLLIFFDIKSFRITAANASRTAQSGEKANEHRQILAVSQTIKPKCIFLSAKLLF